jgi:hypothetical protein
LRVIVTVTVTEITTGYYMWNYRPKITLQDNSSGDVYIWYYQSKGNKEHGLEVGKSYDVALRICTDRHGVKLAKYLKIQK